MISGTLKRSKLMIWALLGLVLFAVFAGLGWHRLRKRSQAEQPEAGGTFVLLSLPDLKPLCTLQPLGVGGGFDAVSSPDGQWMVFAYYGPLWDEGRCWLSVFRTSDGSRMGVRCLNRESAGTLFMNADGQKVWIKSETSSRAYRLPDLKPLEAGVIPTDALPSLENEGEDERLTTPDGRWTLKRGPFSSEVDTIELHAKPGGLQGVWAVTSMRLSNASDYLPYRLFRNGKFILLAKTAFENTYANQPAVGELEFKGDKTTRWKAHMGAVHSVDLNAQSILSGGYDRLVKLWDDSGRCLKTFQGHQAPVVSVRLSPDGRLAASMDERGGQIRVWDTASGSCINPMPFPGKKNEAGPVPFLWHAREPWLLVALSGELQIVDARSGQCLQSLTYDGMGDWGLAFSPDGKRMALLADGGVNLVDASTWALLAKLPFVQREAKAEEELQCGYTPRELGQLRFSVDGAYLRWVGDCPEPEDGLAEFCEWDCAWRLDSGALMIGSEVEAVRKNFGPPRNPWVERESVSGDGRVRVRGGGLTSFPE